MTSLTTRTLLSLPDISCAHCKASIEAAVAPLRGAAAVHVDVAGRTVTVDHGPALASGQALIDAIEGVGYEVAGRREEALG